MKTRQPIRSARITVVSLLAAVCAQMPAASRAQQENVDECELLRTVVAQDDTGFADLKIRKTTSSFVDVWDTKPVFPNTDCKILEWGRGLVHYTCTWKMEDESGARQTFEEYAPRVQECLGADWGTSNLVANTGEGTLFSKPEEDTAVSLRYFREKGLGASWQTTLTVGKRVQINKPQ